MAIVVACSAAASADDVAVKTPASPRDIAFGAGVYSDYVSRGVSQSKHKPSVNVYFEPRYNVSGNLQLYASIVGWSIALPNRRAWY